MRIVNVQSFPNLCQGPVCGIEKSVRTQVIQWPDPFTLQYSPECFGNVQMWGIRRQIEKEKSSFLPNGAHLLYFMISMNSSIVKNHKRVLIYTERECIEKTDHLLCGNALHSGEPFILVLAAGHSKDVESCVFLRWDAYLLSGQLPTIRNISFGTDMALIGIVEDNTSLTFLPLKFLQLLVLVLITLRRRGSLWAFSYTLISCAKADKKRLNVRSLASFPVASCQVALALLTLCLSCLMAARTTCSSEQSIIGFRPRPGRVCRPKTPSERKRCTQAFTETKLISVCSPAFAEDKPLLLRRTARQRMRKQWLVPWRKPFSSSKRWESVSSSFFIFPIANCIY